MKNKILISIFFVSFTSYSSAQIEFSLSDENIISKSLELKRVQEQRNFFPVGHINEYLVYQLDLNKSYGKYFSYEGMSKIYYNEKTKTIIDSIVIKRTGRKIVRILQSNNLTLYHGFYSIPSEYEDKTIDELYTGQYPLNYQDFWIDLNGNTLKIASSPEYYLDKTIVCFLDYSGRYLTYNNYSGEYLRSSIADSTILIYDFENISNGLPNKQAVYCEECINMQIVGNNLYYGQKFYYEKGSDSYDFKVYMAPNNDFKKNILLGNYFEPLLVSPDGKYILAKTDLHNKYTFVIINTETKMYDYIIGRDYYKYKYFYSPAYKQFAFDTRENIIYINYPKNFPFSALNPYREKPPFSKEKDKAFWESHKHGPQIPNQ